MKKIVVFILVIALLTLAVTPALAASGTSAKGEKSNNGNGGNGTGAYYANMGEQFYAVAGTITALGSNTVTILVVAGSNPVHEFIGQEITLQTTEDTRFLLACSYDTPDITDVIEDTECTANPITFAELAVGQNVSSKGLIDANGDGVLDWTAERITVGAELTTNYINLDCSRNQNRNQTGRP